MMKLFQRIFFAAVLAGAVAGLCLAAVQQWRVVPFILEAEQYETADSHEHTSEQAVSDQAEASADASQTELASNDGHTHTQDDANDESSSTSSATETEPWAPADGWERSTYTVLATLLVSIGFSLIVAAVTLLSGLAITPANGLLWGLGGFITFAMAPAVGLPPELPGMAAAEVLPRQIWWASVALLTGAALVGYAKFKSPLALVVGLAVIAIPHIAGAPQPPHDPSDVPAHLASGFAATTLAASLIFWLLVGVLNGWFNRYFAKEKA